jgi:hypothetical protein
LAVAGFSPNEISVTAGYNVVTIESGKAERECLYRGISARFIKPDDGGMRHMRVCSRAAGINGTARSSMSAFSKPS